MKMKTIADVNTYNSATVRLTEQLLERLNGSNDKYSKMLFSEQKRGRIEHFTGSEHYRLFFLLEGKVFLKGLGFGKYILYPQEFMLLPSGSNISCGAAQEAKYVVLNCTGLKSEGNIAYLEELKMYTSEQQSGFISLPIHNKLKRILKSFCNYTDKDDSYPSIYDAVFIVLRSLYSEKEMLSLLLPMLQKERFGDLVHES